MDSAIYILSLVISISCIIHLLLYKRDPLSTLTWMFFVLLVPFIGGVFYFLFGPQRLIREAIKRRGEIERSLGNMVMSRIDQERGSTLLPTEDNKIFDLTRNASEYSLTWGNNIEFISDPHQALAAMEEAIEKAKKYIHLEYYIISSDEVTEQLFAGIAMAAKRGVEVRILYDSLGSLFLKKIYFRKLAAAGAKIAGFLPLSSITERFNLNFRNHRKILIVDGKVAFTGGANIGKEYLGLRFETQWRDYIVRVQGAVCLQLQDVFAKDWHFTTKEDLFAEKYYPQTTETGGSVIQVLESGPDSKFQSIHQALFLALNNSDREIVITTPYFIPDASILSALTVAALRGVRVRLIVPRKNDSPFVQFASRSFYEELMQAGVELYEYLPRILHAKLISIDQKWVVLGSANMDVRSFRLNFELNLLVYGPVAAKAADELIAADLAQSERIDPTRFRKRPVISQLVENTCRLFTPIL